MEEETRQGSKTGELGRRQGMKTSLKQLGHFSDVLCLKGFWGHIVCDGMHVHTS